MPTYPASPVPATVRRTTGLPSNVTYSRDLKRYATNVGTHRFSFVLDYPPQERADADQVFAFFNRVGRATTFNFTDPSYEGPRGSVTGTISMAAAGSARDTSISATGFAVSTTGVLLAGDYLKFTGHDKVYIVLSDVDSDASGAATITVSPGLQAAVSGSTEIFHTAETVVFTCAFSNDMFSMDIDESRLYGFSTVIEEVLT